MALSKPSILLLFEDLNALRNSAFKVYKKLIKSKIIHTSIDSLFEHLLELDNDNEIDIWWNNKKVLKSRIEFCKLYASDQYNISKQILTD